MFRKFAVILTTFITSLFLLTSPARAEGIFPNFDFNNQNQSSYVYEDTQGILKNVGYALETAGNIVEDTQGLLENVGYAVETVGDIVEVVTVGGTAICVVGSVASTTIFPPAAAILPYCSAIGILDSGNAATKVIKERKTAWKLFNYVF